MRILFPLVIAFLLLPSCKIWNPNQLFRTGSGYDYAELPPYEATEYRIAPGDRLEVVVMTNDGYKLVDAGMASVTAIALQQGGQLTYLVDQDGVVRLPQLDTVTVIGLSVLEAAWLLEDLYEDHLVDPFVQVTVANRRVFVFRGDDAATVVTLENENMTLMEVLAAAGGVPPTGKSYKIKIVRGEPDKPTISLVDLRDPAQVQKGNIIVQANDVIVVDPTFETTFLQQLTPFFAFATSAVAVYALVVSLGN